MFNQLARRLRDRVARRPPDFVLVRHDGQTYMNRWYVWPRNRLLCLYLHQFVGSDDDKALHDHPGRNFSYIIEGGYDEVTPDGVHKRSSGAFITRPAEAMHRVVLWRYGVGREMPCWTLFVSGPKYREWGFACPQGWKVHHEFVSHGGCGED